MKFNPFDHTPEANIIVGSALEDSLDGRMRVSVVATGIEIESSAQRPIISSPRLAAVSGHSIPNETPDLKTAVVRDTPMPPVAAPQSEVTMSTAFSGDTNAGSVLETRIEGNEGVNSSETAPVIEEGTPLPLNFNQRVPAPKPPEAEPEPIAAIGLNKVDLSVTDGPFISPPASLPERDRSLLNQPDPLAEAEVINPTDKLPKRRGFSLFRRKNIPEQGSLAASAILQRPLETKGKTVASDNSAETDSNKIQERSENSYLSDMEVDPVSSPSSLAPPQTEEDLLEIPSFLRRQAN